MVVKKTRNNVKSFSKMILVVLMVFFLINNTFSIKANDGGTTLHLNEDKNLFSLHIEYEPNTPGNPHPGKYGLSFYISKSPVEDRNLESLVFPTAKEIYESEIPVAGSGGKLLRDFIDENDINNANVFINLKLEEFGFEKKNYTFDIVFPEGTDYRLLSKPVGLFKDNKIENITFNNLLEVGNYAFSTNSLTALDSEHIKNVGNYAFELNQLTNVNFSKVENIGVRAFYNNLNLKNVVMPELRTIEQQAFMATGLEEVDFPKVESVGLHAFYNLSSLKKVDMANVITIAENAFAHNKLVKVNMPKVQSLGDYAFYNNKALTELNMPELTKIGNQSLAFSGVEEVDMPKLKHIGEYAFYATSLQSLTLETFPEALAATAFSGLPIRTKYFGLFPLYIEDEPLRNKIILDKGVIVNPSEDLNSSVDDILGEDNDLFYITEVVNTDNKFNFATGVDRYGNYYFCVDSLTGFVGGFYEKTTVEDAVYIIEHGASETDTVQKFAIDEAPEEYKYGYSNSLFSKFVHHLELYLENNDISHLGSTRSLLYLVASNPGIEDKIYINEENFENIIQSTKLYSDVKDWFGSDILDHLFEAVKSDDRNYTSGHYLIRKGSLTDVINEQNLYKNTQDIYQPGIPIEMGDVTITYEDTKGNELEPVTKLNGQIGKDWTSDQKVFEGYKFKEVKGNTSGQYTTAAQEVTYVYWKEIPATPIDPIEMGDVTITYEDTKGNELEPVTKLNGQIGKDWTSDQKVFEGYKFKEVKGNTSGQYTTAAQEVVYVYDSITEEKVESTVPNTGISTNVGLYSSTLAASLGGLFIAMRRKSKRK